MQFVRLTLAALILLFLTGCDYAAQKIEAFEYKETSVGYSKCVSDNENQLIDAPIIRKLCANEHSVSFDTDTATGKASFNRYGTFYATIENTSDFKIVTEIKVVVNHDDYAYDSGGRKPIRSKPQKVWIEPGDSREVYFGDLEFTPESDRRDYSDDIWSWYISGVQGIPITLK